MFICCKRYPTRIILLCLALATAVTTVSCDGHTKDTADTTELTTDEKYLIDAYVEVQLARSHYPHKPAVADSIFAVLDSTIDSVRIANIIRDINQEPERWAAVMEEIERRFEEYRENPEQAIRQPGHSE